MDKVIMEADQVYVVMRQDYRISRNIRAQWYFNHLGKVIHLKPKLFLADCQDEIDVVSIIPKGYNDIWSVEESYKFNYLITPSSKVTFLGRQYRLVYCLDLSPSVATVDIQRGNILFDEIYIAVEKSLKGVVRPFYIPGCKFLFQPRLYVTVFAHVPFCISRVQQVIVQGWIVTPENVLDLLDIIHKRLQELGASVAEATARANKQRYIAEPEKYSDFPFGDIYETNQVMVPSSSSEISMINMLRYGILSLQLLPENSIAGIAVITDGTLCLPNTPMLESLLTQLRNSTICCSFLQIGSKYHPFACFGFVPYTDLLNFIAIATCGDYLSSCPSVEEEEFNMNLYHKAFYCWSFQRDSKSFHPKLLENSSKKNEWVLENTNFYNSDIQSAIRKKQMGGSLSTTLSSILSCRLREGYSIKSVNLNKRENQIEVKLLLPWKFNVSIEYSVTSPWSPNMASDLNKKYVPSTSQICSYEVIVEGSYELLHDVTCAMKKPIKSLYRSAVIRQFWNTLKNLSRTDQILAHLHSFSHNPIFYTVPESVKNGVPVFYLPSNSNVPALSLKNSSHTQFASLWEPICRLDINIWQKWMHTHRIGIILEHDVPLSKNIHQPNSNGRYSQVQCRRTLLLLNDLLNEYSSFALLENHSYIKLLFSSPDKPPDSFFIIRVTSKAPCMVIRLAFLGGTPGYKRNEIVKELREKILNMKIPKWGIIKEVQHQKSPDSLRNELPFNREEKELYCCTLLKKPVEKLLIRYERVPSNFATSVSDQCSTPVTYKHPMLFANASGDQIATDILLTLSRYLYHQRWIWAVQNGSSCPITLSAVATILSTITQMRLMEGFCIAHSCDGIISMVKEISMKGPVSVVQNSIHNSDIESNNELQYCVIQYILFPPHNNTTVRDMQSQEDDTEVELIEADGELQIITECWVEPQTGIAVANFKENSYYEGLTYQQFPQSIFSKDKDCVSTLLTLQHLSLMCQRRSTPSFINSFSKDKSSVIPHADEMHHSLFSAARSIPDLILSQTSLISLIAEPNVHNVPFSFNVMKLLPKCQQAELLFSTFIQCLPSLGNLMENENPCLVTIPNQLLFDYLMDAMNKIHDQEIPLSVYQMLLFPLLVHRRERESNIYPPPFECPESNLDANYQFCTEPNVCQLSDDIAKWRCFVKGISEDHITITVIPASYQDLRHLIFGKQKSSRLTKKSVTSLFVENDVNTSFNKNMYRHEDGISFQRNKQSMELTNVPMLSNDKHHPSVGSLTLPIYVYDCSLNEVVNTLINCDNKKNWKDVYQDLMFKTAGDHFDITIRNDDDSNGQSKQISPEPQSDNSEEMCGKRQLHYLCVLIEIHFQKSFAYSLYRSLQLGSYINKHDVEAVVDGLCKESLIEINITQFLQIICGHVKDFCMKAMVEQKFRSSEKINSKDMQNREDENNVGNHNSTHDSISDSCENQEWPFPLEVLQRHQPCEPLQQLHSNIKNRFMLTLQHSFKPIQSHPNYYYYCVEQQENLGEVSVNMMEEQENRLDDGALTDTVEFSSEAEITVTNDYTHDSERVSNNSDTQSILSSLVEEEHFNSIVQEVENPVPPLFIHMTCSVRRGKDVGSCLISTLPTCLGEVINCLKPKTPDIILNDVHITLDLLCLSLPFEIEYPASLHLPQTKSSESDNAMHETTLPSEEFPSGRQVNSLGHIPTFQHQAINDCVDKIQWMLQDEIASAALNTYPLQVSTIEMVATHVKSSNNYPCCLTAEVPLHFVFGADTSLDKFTQEFQQMSVPGFHLNKEENYYYLVIDAETAEEMNRPFGSLIPPLGTASKYLIIQANPHCDDSTELRNITEPSSIYHEKDARRSSDTNLPKNNAQDTTHTQLFSNSSSTSPVLNTLQDYLRHLILKNEDESETEDGDDESYIKSSAIHNLNSKFQSKNFREEFKAYSVPLCSSHTILIDKHNEPSQVGHSAPAEFPIFMQCMGTVQEWQQVTEESDEPLYLERVFEDETILSELESSESNEYSPLHKPSSPEIEMTGSIDEHNKKHQIGVEDIWARKADYMSKNDFLLPNQQIEFVASSTFHPTEDSLGSTPIVYNELDFTNYIAGSHISNTEEGYEGDSSESDSDWDWLNALDTKRPLLPGFWLIMEIFKDKVYLYFHLRHRSEEDTELKQSKEILEQVTDMIKNICKVVNQSLLLQELHETRMCNQLLVPEASEDIWKNDSSTIEHSKALHRVSSFDDYSENDYLEATLKFMPGTFDCNMIWQMHFTLHHRLNTGPSHNSLSRGIQALRTVLNAFSVNNRNNMFVYQERSGSVFYLRLHEIRCSGYQVELHKEDSIYFRDSCNSSMLSLTQKKNVEGDDESLHEFRPALLEKDQAHDTISYTSYNIPQKQRFCIALHVHGISEVGPDIKEGLVKVLQSRLDDAVLVVITTMLARNPMCKLTPEDVHFIQKPGKEPSFVLHFTLHAQAFPYLHAVGVYLRQNLLHFLHNPKYMDSKPEHHFQPYVEDISQFATYSDDDAFLYIRHQALGLSGNTGIACIILSVVDGQGRPVKHISYSLPSPNAYRDGIASYEYDELTFTTLYEPNINCRSPGPVALIRFQIWCVGKVDLAQLSPKLGDAVRHSLWDLLMEFRLLTAPLADISLDEEFTQFKMRRSGLVMVEQSQSAYYEKYFSPIFLPSKGHELCCVQDTDNHSPMQSPLDTIFKFSESHTQKLSTQPNQIDNNVSLLPLKLHEKGSPATTLNGFETGDKGKLQSTFQSTMKTFLEFGKEIGSPIVTKSSCTLNNRYPVSLVLKEFQSKIAELTPDIVPRIFQQVTADNGLEFIPFKSIWNSHQFVDSNGLVKNDGILPGKTKNYIIIGRNVNQWKAYMGYSEFYSFIESLLLPAKNKKSFQRFQPELISCQDNYKTYESTPTSPVSKSIIVKLPTPLSAPHGNYFGSTVSRNSSPINTLDISGIPFVPRQRMLLVYIIDRELTVYLYNWAVDLCNAICKMLTEVVQWHNRRSIVMNNIVAQKLGLFHSKAMSQITEVMTLEKSQSGQIHMKNYATSYLDILIKHHNPPQREYQGISTTSGRRVSPTAKSNRSPYLNIFRDSHPPQPLHKSAHGAINDLVMRHGKQLLEAYNVESRDLQDLYKMWQSRGASLNISLVDKLLQLLKKVARLEHYCLTPILFSPSWRWKVAPIRDHTLHSLLSPLSTNIQIQDLPIVNRSRHSSGNSNKGNDGMNSSGTRSRKVSGSSYQLINNLGRSSRHTSEEAWHFAVCSHYIREYIQYLQSLGFVTIQTKMSSTTQSFSMKGFKLKEEEIKPLIKNTSSLSKTSIHGLPVYYLIRSMLGGLLVFEVGFNDPYAFCHLYSLECLRLQSCSSRVLSSQFTTAFVDELDKIKVVMHLHSFTYDYHLRTIHSYISGQQLIFRHGYHLTSFLDDFIKYYQKSPSCARNLIYNDSLGIVHANLPANQLYNYIISHNKSYGMRVLRMVPIVYSFDMEVDTEFALVETLSSCKVSYSDSSDVRQVENFDVGMLIIHDTAGNEGEKSQINMLVLKYYIILTSQRELYPKLFTCPPTLGTFKPVRLGMPHVSGGTQSRKCSTASHQSDNKQKFDDSGEHSDSNENIKSQMSSRAMCDEEVTYLGYFSSQETCMQQVMCNCVQMCKAHLEEIVKKAALHCRRDFLWNDLLPHGSKEESSNKEKGNGCINYSEFSELLKLVTVLPLNDIDENLSPFLNMHISWYHGLTKVLTYKYGSLHRYFISPDGNTYFVAVTHSKYQDIFMLLHVNLHSNRAELSLVLREPLSGQDVGPEKSNQRLQIMHCLVEDFVNVCCFHLWSGIIG